MINLFVHAWAFNCHIRRVGFFSLAWIRKPMRQELLCSTFKGELDSRMGHRFLFGFFISCIETIEEYLIPVLSYHFHPMHRKMLLGWCLAARAHPAQHARAMTAWAQVRQISPSPPLHAVQHGARGPAGPPAGLVVYGAFTWYTHVYRMIRWPCTLPVSIDGTR